LFSVVLLSFIALVSLYSFLLLVKAKFVVSGSFGDIGGALYGPWMRYAILTSIVVSQIGFVSAYMIFVSENLQVLTVCSLTCHHLTIAYNKQAFVAAVSNCMTILPIKYLIMIQMVVFLPLALIRNIAKLSTTALVADVFIVAGLIYIFGSEAVIMSHRGPSKVELFNSKDFTLMIG
jgi:solute carrier family 36 (proton-coupled amino acid transporter)